MINLIKTKKEQFFKNFSIYFLILKDLDIWKKKTLFSTLLFLNLVMGLLEGTTFGFIALAVACLSREKIEVFETLQELLSRYIHENSQGFILYLLGAVLTQFFASFVKWSAAVLLNSGLISIKNSYNEKLSNRFFKLNYPYLISKSSGHIDRILSFAEKDIQILILQLHKLSGTVLEFLILFACFALMSLKLFSILFSLFLLHRILNNRLKKKLTSLSEKRYELTCNYLSSKITVNRSLKIIYAIHAFSFFAKDLAQKFRKMNVIILRHDNISAFMNFAGEMAGVIGIALCLITGSLFISKGTLTLSVLLTSLAIVRRLVGKSSELVMASAQLANTRVEIESFQTFFKKEEKRYRREGGIPISHLKNEIAFKDISFHYGEAKKKVLSHISFKISKGRSLGIVGPSGAGKTTIIDLLLGLFPLEQGKIEIDGIGMDRIDLEKWQNLIGIVSQDSQILNETVWQNIAFGQETIDKERAIQAARHAQAEGFIEKLPHQFDTKLGERGIKISGGERQRLSIARAFYRDPELLILDEATSHLDVEKENDFQEALEELMKGKTLIVIAHRLSTIQTMDSILFVEHGRIVEEGNHMELLEKGGRYAAFWKAQSEKRKKKVDPHLVLT